MKIITVQFNYRNTIFERLLTAFRNSINLHMPDVGLTEYTYNFDKTRNNIKRGYSVITNTFKLDRWVEILEQETENLCFSDCDMLMTNRIDDVWEYDFDVAYTYRRKWKETGQGIPYNGGVIFTRPNERSTRFFKRWAEVNRMMVEDQQFHAKWRKKYAGINQSAFGYLIENESDICKLKELPCPTWNSVDESWTEFNKDTKMLHIKSQLRRCCLGSQRMPSRLQPIVELWHWYEKLKDNKDKIYNKISELNLNEKKKINNDIPLSIIIPKLNDPHLRNKIENELKSYDDLIILKNIKQDYKKLLKNSKYDNVLIINPSNYRLINKPHLINNFRTTDEFLYSNPNRLDKSSIKIKKSLVYDKCVSGIISLKNFINKIGNISKNKKLVKMDILNVNVFSWKDCIDKDELLKYCATNDEDFNGTVHNITI